MFNLEQQVVSLELAKRLKELNVKQESYFYWNTDKAFIGEDNMYVVQKKDCRSVKDGYSIDEYSAFTVAELGEMLPVIVDTKDARGTFDFVISKTFSDKKWFVGYSKINLGRIHSDDQHYTLAGQQYERTLADALGKMLIYLLENNLIEVKALIQEEKERL